MLREWRNNSVTFAQDHSIHVRIVVIGINLFCFVLRVDGGLRRSCLHLQPACLQPCARLVIVVPEGMSQVSRGLVVGNYKQRSLNTRLSSGTSTGTLASPAGPYRKCSGEVGTKNEPSSASPYPEGATPTFSKHVSRTKTTQTVFPNED